MKKVVFFIAAAMMFPYISFAEEAYIVSSKSTVSSGSQGGIESFNLRTYPINEETKKKI